MKKILNTVLILCLLTAVLTGCTATPEKTQAISVVLNTTEVFHQVDPMTYSDYIYDAMYSNGNVAVIIADGEPELDYHAQNKKSDKNLDAEKRRQIAVGCTNQVLMELQNLQPEQEETNTLESIALAADYLRGTGAEHQTLLVISSFLDTQGMLNYAEQNLLECDPTLIVEQLEANHAIPDLQGIEVICYGLGQTAGPQPALDSKNKTNLLSISETILMAGKPAKLTINPSPLTDVPCASVDKPHCSTVSFVTSTLSVPQTAEEPQGEPAMTNDTVIRIDETSVRFLPDQAVLADPEAASDALKPVADQLLQSNIQVILAGTTASVGGDGIDLSEARAETIKQVLVEEFAVPADQIRCVGLGRRDWSMRAHDLDSNENLIEEQAKLNRAVFLFSADSDKAHELGL